jgi:hypothetical protein
VKYLACPSSAPWLKIGDVMDFVDQVKAENVFPTHNIHLSEPGHQLNNGRIEEITVRNGGKFDYFKPGNTFVID